MALTLEDLMAVPNDPYEMNKHLSDRGLIPSPVAQPDPAIATMTPPAAGGDALKSMIANMNPPAPETAPSSGVAPMRPPKNMSTGLPGSWGPSDEHGMRKPTDWKQLEDTDVATHARLRGVNPTTDPEAPDLGSVPGVGGTESPLGMVKNLAPLDHAGKMALPTTSPGADIGSAAHTRAELERMEEAKNNPWGTAENHPGILGKIGHVLGRVGNTALDVLAPGISLAVPGGDLNKLATENSLKRELASRTTAEGDAANKAENLRQEGELRKLQGKNLQSEIDTREGQQELIKDANNEVVGYKDQGGMHGLDDAPQEIKDIAEASKNAPKYETDKNSGNIVKLTTDKNGKTTSEVVYQGQPNVKTETRSIVGADGKAHDLVFDVTPNSPNFGKKLADLGRAKEDKAPSLTSELAKQKDSEKVVLAYDKDNVAHLMSKADAEEEGMKHITSASSGDIDKAKTHHVVLNTLQTQLNNVYDARKALDQGIVQRGIIASALSHPSDSTMDAAWRATVMAGASEQTKDYVQAVIALREAGLALPKEITGGSRVSEVQASALWHTMPSAASLDSKYATKQIKKFQQDVDRLRQRAPLVRGMDIVDAENEMKSKNERQHTVNGGAAGGNTIKMGGQEIPLGDDGTFTYKGHQYKTTPGSKQATLVK